MPRPGARLNLDPRCLLESGLDRASSEAPGGWLLVYLIRQSSDPSIKAGPSTITLAGVSNTSISRQRHSDQKPRHFMTLLLVQGGMQGLRVCKCAEKAKAQGSACPPKHGLQGFGLALGGAVSKNVWVLFLGGARFPLFLESCGDSHGFTAAPVCPLPARVMHHRRRNKWAPRGMIAGLVADALNII
ncbi:hypothetical protein N431DRAFT_431662 [Stipitochalara longipes BDJ]|nr:hypothetical protein N431DRAFT_431662 [Stipitochalara longipes BDJ]